MDSLEELEFDAGFLQLSPASIFRFSATLRVVNIRHCYLPDTAVQGLHFPQLKKLGLEHVHVSERSLHGLIAGCPVLEFLLVLSSSGFRCLRINPLSLTSLCVRMHTDEPKASDKLHFVQMIIENAPCLERLIHIYTIWGLDVSLYSAPKVETLDFLTDLRNFGTKLMSASRVFPKIHIVRLLCMAKFCLPCSIKGLPVDSPTTAVQTVKSLSVNMYQLSLDKVVDLMRLFPCLEKLHVKSDASGAKNFWRRKHERFIRYHDIRLKTLVLEPYLGTSSHVNFATFFVLKARVLELMKFQIEAKVYTDEFLAEQHRKLQLEYRASSGARFHFTTSGCQHADWSTKHLRDFDLNDPFLRGC